MKTTEQASSRDRRQTETFLPYMRDVSRCEQSLQELNMMWRVIEASAKMNCPTEARTILPTMAATRTGFSRLESELVASLVQEKVSTVIRAIGTKAQYVIDIVVRNLFERTADVGFLATDHELCAFVAGLNGDQSAAHHRLREYRSKYTVYDEIILLDLDGNVLAQIDPDTPLEHSKDPLLAETLASDTYVETFRASELRPHKDRALIYSRRMHHPETNAVIGVLCLCFNFEQEMAGIFHSHRDTENRSVMLLLGSDNRVIASGDPLWINTGTLVPVKKNTDAELMLFCGREYLVRTFSSDGYQNYPGPTGWQGQVMIPVEIAFSGIVNTMLSELDPGVAEGLLSHANTFCTPLFDIMNAAKTIQRVVWNGQVMTAGQNGELDKLKTILDQISETGNRTNELFAQSIRDLYQTVLSSGMREAEFTSHLLVDLLDRNLYERSDDCRWWALTPELRTALALPEQDAALAEKLTGILTYINDLYTVYTRIFVYDRHGVIIASTGPQDGPIVTGERIDPDTLSRVLKLDTTQDYHVSPFAATTLYDNADTYIYHAAIRDMDNASLIVGGIGIVFDSTPEFVNMLNSGLGDKKNMAAFFIDRNGRILSSTDPTHAVGSQLTIDADLLQIAKGESASRITVHNDQYATVACTASNGYREFKVSDGYQEDVIAVVFESFGAVRNSGMQSAGSAGYVLEADVPHTDASEYATFFSDQHLMAIDAAHILEAVPFSEVQPTSMSERPAQIGVLSLKHDDNIKEFIWVFDLGHLVRGTLSTISANSQVMITRHGKHTIGLMVDELHAVTQFSPLQIIPTPFATPGVPMLATKVIKANKGTLLIQSIDVERLFTLVLDGQLPPEPEEEITPLLAAA
ncbi:chemotaxis protein CheW [Herbaspirillum sp. RTI4]|uniref:chemotaxis protein CheW n=1 Tax=Herbaspirillum sp. RTI4 TaxID=3048640 RepID=UPI002AB4C23E|nr:chemotaxis protein CheW [Herbaspirillum sp. RTI4]MDY7576951.1 chemotaxis protein CheW [Herbaspirillum sp. RTI4]MEA9982147.1 chemotaxis protein CheW [Herbaspirillum sp. RTI4]